MAFPGTYNISYYKGDTLEFRVYPKDSSGAAFDLEDYEDEYGNSPIFTISTSRGQSGIEDQISAYASISEDGSHILCVIRPEDGNQLEAGTSYVYDIEISKESEEYDIVHTLLTGAITVTDQVGITDFGAS
jgi:hypothetical protein